MLSKLARLVRYKKKTQSGNTTVLDLARQGTQTQDEKIKVLFTQRKGKKG